MGTKLTDEQRSQALDELRHWLPVNGREAISREFRFADFPEAWAFMSRVAMLAEKQDHHPEWSNVYNRVEIVLTTHDAGGLSAKDVAMARAIDSILA